MTDLPEYQYGQFTDEHLKKVEKGLHLFNEQKYWECHEELEHCWLEDTGDSARNVYWAIIQVAAALIHYRDGKITGSRGLISRAKEKFKKCEELGVETPLLFEKLSWTELKVLVRKVPAEPELADFENLYEFRFKNFL